VETITSRSRLRSRRPGAAAVVGGIVVALLCGGGIVTTWMLQTSRDRFEAANVAADMQGDLSRLNDANWDITRPGTVSSATTARSTELEAEVASGMASLTASGIAVTDVSALRVGVDAYVAGSMRERVLAILHRSSDALAQADQNDAQFQELSVEVDGVVAKLRENADDSAALVERGVLAVGAVLVALVATFLGWDGRRRRRSARLEGEASARVRFEAIVERSSDFIVLTSPDGTAIYVSPSMTSMLGYSSTDGSPATLGRLVHPDDAAELARILSAVRDDGQAGPSNCRIRHADGEWRTLEMSVVDLTAVPEVGAMVWTSRDVTDRETAHAKLRDSEARLAEAQQLASLGHWSYEISTEVLTCSDGLYGVIGVDPELGIASFDRFMLLVHPDDQVRATAFLQRVLEDFTAFADELRITTPALEERWLALRATPVLDAHGQVVEMRGTLQDITDRKMSESQLVHLALHDMLTGLPNRALFSDRLEAVIADRGASVAVMLLDVDGFKAINDSLGHSAGDAFLVAVAERLRAAVRPADTVARFGGDEFTVLLECADEGEAIAVADRMLKLLADPFEVDGKKIQGQASIGLAFGATDVVADELLRDADTAMYAAKRKGGNRYELFSADLHAEVVERLALEFDLRTVELGAEMNLHYQPLIDLRTGRVTGFEALLRWNHPERGSMSPADFIPIAEESGAIIPIGRWVLEEACRQAGVWQRSFPEYADLSMNVNVSARQLSDCDIVGDVAHALAVSGLDPALLTLEITETMIMTNEDEVGLCLRRLKDLGVRISVDDFGTGYSSLGHLDRFPVDELKIDRSFVAHLGEDAGDGTVAMAVIRLARGLHIDVVAEGIESAAQLAQLRAAACTRGQGYYFWKALEPDAAADLLRRSVRPILPEASACTILVVDDDDTVRRTTSRVLAGAGYEVVEAATGREALKHARHLRFDGVLLDIRLPDASGVEVCRQLKSMYDGDLVVLHVSGSAVTVDDRVLGLDSGADGYLVKPVAPAELVATLESALRGRRVLETAR
jgi:diguanylate cyclase (GGDEF)-like protein/PAS domain S-box-containing protein